MPALSYVVWRDQFSVGRLELDSQHKLIFQLLNELYDALEASQDNRPIRDILDAACLYADVHFQREEAILLACGYPDFATHQKEHQDYARKVQELLAVRGTREEMYYECFQFLKQWWLRHVTRVDKEYVPYLKTT